MKQTRAVLPPHSKSVERRPDGDGVTLHDGPLYMPLSALEAGHLCRLLVDWGFGPPEEGKKP